MESPFRCCSRVRQSDEGISSDVNHLPNEARYHVKALSLPGLPNQMSVSKPVKLQLGTGPGLVSTSSSSAGFGGLLSSRWTRLVDELNGEAGLDQALEVSDGIFAFLWT